MTKKTDGPLPATQPAYLNIEDNYQKLRVDELDQAVCEQRRHTKQSQRLADPSRSAFFFSAIGFSIIFCAFLSVLYFTWVIMGLPTHGPENGFAGIEFLLLNFVIVTGASILAAPFYIASCYFFFFRMEDESPSNRYGALTLLSSILYTFFVALIFPPFLIMAMEFFAKILAFFAA